MVERLRVGDSVEVYGNATPELQLGVCRVVGVERDVLVVATPRFAVWSQSNGQPVRVSWKTETGVFIGSGWVDSEADAFGQVLRLRFAGEWRKLQRRENVRLSVSLRVPRAVLLREDVAAPLDAKLLNISASGCLLHVRPLPPPNARIGLSIELPNAASPVEVEGIVVRIDAEDSPTTKEGRVAIRFDGHSARTQDRIVRFIFREQIRRLRAD